MVHATFLFFFSLIIALNGFRQFFLFLPNFWAKTVGFRKKKCFFAYWLGGFTLPTPLVVRPLSVSSLSEEDCERFEMDVFFLYTYSYILSKINKKNVFEIYNRYLILYFKYLTCLFIVCFYSFPFGVFISSSVCEYFFSACVFFPAPCGIAF